MTDTSREAHHTHLRNHNSKFIEQAQAVIDTSREALIKELRVAAELLQIGKVEDWDGLAAGILQAADMLEADGKAQQVAVPVPLSDEQIEAACRFIEPSLDGPIAYDLLIARAIERAHGIGEKP